MISHRKFLWHSGGYPSDASNPGLIIGIVIGVVVIASVVLAYMAYKKFKNDTGKSYTKTIFLSIACSAFLFYLFIF